MHRVVAKHHRYAQDPLFILTLLDANYALILSQSVVIVLCEHLIPVPSHQNLYVNHHIVVAIIKVQQLITSPGKRNTFLCKSGQHPIEVFCWYRQTRGTRVHNRLHRVETPTVIRTGAKLDSCDVVAPPIVAWDDVLHDEVSVIFQRSITNNPDVEIASGAWTGQIETKCCLGDDSTGFHRFYQTWTRAVTVGTHPRNSDYISGHFCLRCRKQDFEVSGASGATIRKTHFVSSLKPRETSSCVGYGVSIR